MVFERYCFGIIKKKKQIQIQFLCFKKKNLRTKRFVVNFFFFHYLWSLIYNLCVPFCKTFPLLLCYYSFYCIGKVSSFYFDFRLFQKLSNIWQRKGVRFTSSTFLNWSGRAIGLYMYLLMLVNSLRVPLSFYPKRFGKKVFNIPSILFHIPTFLAFQFLREKSYNKLPLDNIVSLRTHDFIELFQQNFDRMKRRHFFKRFRYLKRLRFYDTSQFRFFKRLK